MESVYTFPCKKWFGKNIGDGKIERELKLSKHYSDGEVAYSIQVFTGYSFLLAVSL